MPLSGLLLPLPADEVEHAVQLDEDWRRGRSIDPAYMQCPNGSALDGTMQETGRHGAK